MAKEDAFIIESIKDNYPTSNVQIAVTKHEVHLHTESIEETPPSTSNVGPLPAPNAPS